MKIEQVTTLAGVALTAVAVGIAAGAALVARRSRPEPGEPVDEVRVAIPERIVSDWLDAAMDADTVWQAEHAYRVGRMLGLQDGRR